MIVKKIRRRTPASRSGRAELAYMVRVSRYIVCADARDLHRLVMVCEDDYLRDLARYAVADGREVAAVASGAMNLFGSNLEEWQAEMATLLHRSKDSSGAIDHWVFSWPEGEQPTAEEAERIIRIFLRCQGLAKAPAVWGYHGDTENAHIHLQVVRLDRQTGARLTGGDGWDIDTAHRAKAVIEAQFPHWTSEEGSRYAVREGDLIERASNQVIGKADDPTSWKRRRDKSGLSEQQRAPQTKQIDPEAIAYEEATGFMSRTRVALEIAVPIVLAAPTLDAAHAALAEQGIELRTKGSGAAFIIDSKPVKASVDRRTSLAALAKRFDTNLTQCPYKIASHVARERWPDDPQRHTYFALRRAHDERLRAAVSDARSALGAHGQGLALAAALRTAMASAAFPSFEAWAGGAEAPEPASVIMGAMGFSTISVEPKTQSIAMSPVAGFRGTRLGHRTVYHPEGRRVGPPAFVDVGHKVLVYASTDRAAVRASLLLIANRYPDHKVTVTGNRKFKNLVLELALEESISLDGDLGRRQAAARVVADQIRTVARPPSARPTTVERAPQVQPVQLTPATNPQAKRRLYAVVAKLFHSADWAAGDHWGTNEARHARVDNLPTMVRSTTDLPGVLGDRDAQAARKAAAMRARYAESVAATSLSR